MPLKVRLNLDYVFILFTKHKLEISCLRVSLHCFNRLCQMVINTGNRGSPFRRLMVKEHLLFLLSY